MNILIINQPVNNRGDESAHKALVRTINKKFPKYKVTVYFSGINPDSVDQMEVKHGNNTYINNFSFRKGRAITKRVGLQFNLIKLSSLHPNHRPFIKELKKNDLIISAPGGPAIGPYYNMNDIYWLKLASVYNKEIAYYSRSIGPFEAKTPKQKLLLKVGTQLLSNFSFLSLRDKQSIALGNKLGFKFTSSIDTAFLEQPKVNLPLEISNKIMSKRCIVFVPNTINWAPTLREIPDDLIFDYFSKSLNLLSTIYKDHNIILLPQLHNNTSNTEMIFFNKLQEKESNTNIIVLDEIYSSDIQQSIISKSDLVVGARYHSIVFAINQNVPFVALSYEHKIKGMLEELNIAEHCIDLRHHLKSNTDSDEFIQLLESKIKLTCKPSTASIKAKEIALNCFNEMAKTVFI